MSTEFPTSIDLIQDGEAVRAGTPNRPLSQLSQRTTSLQERVNNALLGSADIAYDVPVETGVTVGKAVYLNDDGLWRPGLATTEIDEDGVETGVARSAFVAGIVWTTHDSTLADVVLNGMMKLTSAQLEAVMVGGEIATGALFLSGTPSKAGWLTSQQPPIGVFVAVCAGPDADDNYTLLVNPSPRKILEDHIHYKVNLAMVQATDTVTAGWVTLSNELLHAGHGSSSSSSSSSTGTDPSKALFLGKTIPNGAKYGYAISADTKLSRLWPPIPLSAVYLERNGTGVRIDGAAGQNTCVVNEDGIWWMSNCAGQIPFGQSTINPGSGCVTYPDQITFWFSRLRFKTNEAVVTQLTAANATIVITNNDGQAASTGALKIKAVIPIDEAGGETGYNAVKEIDTDGITLLKGVVTEGIKSNSQYITVAGVSVNEPSGDSASGFKGGRVTLDFHNPNAPWEGSPNVIHIDNAYVQSPDGVHNIVFRNGVSASIRASWRIPQQDVSDDGMLMTVEFLIMAYGSGTFPDLGMNIRRLPEPDDECDLEEIPTPDTDFDTLDLSDCGAVTANHYLKKTTEQITVYPGDLIFLSISRANDDSYNADLGILDMRWRLSPLSYASSSSSSSSSA